MRLPTTTSFDDCVSGGEQGGGIVRPSEVADLMLMAKRNLVGCSTRIIAGFCAMQNFVDHVGGPAKHIA